MEEGRERDSSSDMSVTDPSMQTVDPTIPGNGFGVPDIYVSEGEKEEDTDGLFVDGDGDHGEETCED
jgi:hypothetical protein